MTGFLINYDASREYRNSHPDPCFDEFTSGNVNQKASFIRNRISKGDKFFSMQLFKFQIMGNT